MEEVDLGTFQGRRIVCILEGTPSKEDREGFLEYVIENKVPLAVWKEKSGIRNQKRKQRVDSWG